MLAAGIVLPWLVFARLYFGSIVPHSLIAKRVIGFIPHPLAPGRLAGYVGWLLGSVWLPYLPKAPSIANLAMSVVWLAGLTLAYNAPTDVRVVWPELRASSVGFIACLAMELLFVAAAVGAARVIAQPARMDDSHGSQPR